VAARTRIVQPGGEKAQVDLIYLHKYLMGRSEGKRTTHFSVVHSDRTLGNGHKLKKKDFSFFCCEHGQTLEQAA